MDNTKDEEILSHKNSFHLIEQMISTARDEHNEKGEGWLIWGFLLFIASAGSAITVYAGLSGYVRWIWMAVLPIGLILYFILHLKNRKKEPVKTYVAELLDKFEKGFFICLFVMIAGNNIIGNYHHEYGNYLFAFFYVLYAFWMFIHGSAIRFKPLIIGAYFNWLAAAFIFFLSAIEHIMLVSAVAVLVGYIIPGLILRRRYQQSIQKR